MGIKLNVLWDFDGTLIDIYPVFTRVFKQVLYEDIPEDIIHTNLKKSFTHAIKYFNLTDDQIESFTSIVNQLPINEFRPFESVEEVLKFANKNMIMTHNDRSVVERIVEYYEWEKYFIEIVTIDDGFPRKPDPASYEYLNKKHSIDLVIGDRVIDIIPAKKLGVKSCLFQNEELGADYYLDDYQNFFKVLNVKASREL